MGISSYNMDYIISKPMYEFLIDEGIEKNNFRPVYSGGNKIKGYRIYGEQNLLPLYTVIPPEVDSRKKCPVCGRIYLLEHVSDN